MKRQVLIEDVSQNYWQLASIQIATIGLPGTLIGGQLTKIYGAGTACLSIFIGNLLLWIIGLVIVLMSSQNRSNAVENVGNYLGRGGAVLASLILTVAFLIWYPINIGYTAVAIEALSSGFKEKQKMLSIIFGIGIALVSVGGIRLIKKICVIAFPILALFLIYAAFRSHHHITWTGCWSISFPAIASVVAVILSGIVNLPTFFRHATSKSHSVFALSVMTICVSLFQFLAIYIGIVDPSDFFSKDLAFQGVFYSLFALIFIVLFSVCVNLGNIYFTSAILDVFAPFLYQSLGAARYILIGLIGALIYITPQGSFFNFTELQTIAEGFIASLDVVLMFSFLVTIFFKHRARLYEKLSSGLCWMIGCITTVIIEIGAVGGSHDSLLAGVGITTLAFLCIIFCEETAWAIRKL